MPLAAGAPFGHYVIERMLGEGGMGCVYLAKDQTLGRRVAIKLLRDQSVDDPKMRERFLREARAGAALSHPNATIVHEVGEHDGQAYIAMEYLQGKTLRAYVGTDAPDVATRVGWLVDVARVLAVSHAAGLVHRDIKPDNVMVTRDGVVKVLDFGIARAASVVVDPMAPTGLPGDEGPRAGTITTEGLVVGTPVYMAPEQMLGKPVDGRADQFAWGVLAYELLSGRVPWQVGADPSGGARLVALIVSDEPAPSLDAAGVPPGVRQVVARALEKDRARRFPTMGAIVEALGPTGARPAASGEAAVSTPPRRRSRVVPLAIAFGLAAAAGVAVYAGRGASPRSTSSSAASAASPTTSASAPAPAVTHLVDLPPPRTSVPEAASAYAAGLQAMQDNSWFIALMHFTEAVTHDSSMAAAHLRLSMMMLVVRDPAARRSEFEKAAGLRTQLDERDKALMEAMQPFLQAEVQDVAEADLRLRALAKRYPKDVEIRAWLGAIHYYTPQGLAPAEDALALDPGDPLSWEIKGDALVVLGKPDEAHAAYERCGANSINGAECFALMSLGDMVAGRCEDFDRDARQAADRSPFWLSLVLRAMASKGAGAEALEETAKQWFAAIPPPLGPDIQRLGLQARLAILAGDFQRAGALAQEESKALAADPHLRSIYWLQYQTTTQLVDIALETGDLNAARRVASDFVARSGAWPREAALGQGVDLSLYFARLAWPMNEPAPPEFEVKRRAWLDERLRAGAYKGAVWNFAYASPALTAEEARAALEALTELGPTTPAAGWGGFGFSSREGNPEADLGRVYLLANRLDEAIPHLERAVAQCDVLSSTLDHVHAELDLGRALELKNDRDGACKAYGKVLARWGAAKPRSVTAAEAKKRAEALACANKTP